VALGDFELEENETGDGRASDHTTNALRLLRRDSGVAAWNTPRRERRHGHHAAEAFLGRALGEAVVVATMATAEMPGRMEIVARNPLIVVDGAHNPAGVRALVATLDGAFDVRGERRCVLGMLTGRDLNDMVAPLVGAGFL